MDVVYRCCCGPNVHKDSVTACVLWAEASGQNRQEKRKFATFHLMELSDWLRQCGVTNAVMESTGVYWKPVWHVLEGHFELLLANAQHVKAIPGKKTDRRDAGWLAELLQHGLLRSSFVPPEPIRSLRDLTRYRVNLAQECNRIANRIHPAVANCRPRALAMASRCSCSRAKEPELMRDSGIAMLFSGQGRCRPESLNSLMRMQPAAEHVFDDIGAPTGHQLSIRLGALISPHILRRSELLSLFTRDEMAILIYGISVATCRHLQSNGWRPQALVGQSFGEIPALVCSGVCSVSEGAAIVQARSISLSLFGAGGCMAVLETGVGHAQRTILQAGSKRVVIAAESSTSETVISGDRSGVQKVVDHAVRAGIVPKYLKPAAALHNPALTIQVADLFHRQIAHLPWQSATIPIFSPALGRFYEPDDCTNWKR